MNHHRGKYINQKPRSRTKAQKAMKCCGSGERTRTGRVLLIKIRVDGLTGWFVRSFRFCTLIGLRIKIFIPDSVLKNSQIHSRLRTIEMRVVGTGGERKTPKNSLSLSLALALSNQIVCVFIELEVLRPIFGFDSSHSSTTLKRQTRKH
jgi:hypothetical protein